MDHRAGRWPAAISPAFVLALLGTATASAHPMDDHGSWTNNDTLTWMRGYGLSASSVSFT